MNPRLPALKRLIAPRSLRLQLLSRSLFILAGLLVLIGICQYVFMSHFLYQSTAAKIRAEIQSAPPDAWEQLLAGTGNGSTSNAPPADGDSSSAQTTQENDPFFALNVASIAYINTKGVFSRLDGAAPMLSQEDYSAALSAEPGKGTYEIARDSAGRVELTVLEPITASQDVPAGVIQVGTYVNSVTQVLFELLVIFVALALFALIIGLFAFLPILRRTLVPLSSMIDTVSRINAGNLEDRVQTNHTQLEIDHLSSSFNDMLDRLETSFEAEREAKEKMRRFVADASHELRTPMTSIHGFLEILLRGAATRPDQLQRALRSMYTEADRIIKLVQDLLLLAQFDREPRPLFADGALDDVIREMEPQLELLAGERPVVFSLADSTHVQLDKDRIKQVILNLFQNAVQHTDAQTGEIHIDLTRVGQHVRLAITDNGPGIPPDQLSKVFERFYRLDASRTRREGGTGLGLAIAQSIASSHGGDITCESELGHGATFIVTLPAHE